jgi:hypothetical protein
MTSRTFPLSRQRRRRTKPIVPVEDGQRLAAPIDEELLGDRTGRGGRDSEGEHGPRSGALPPTARLPHDHDEHTDAPHAPRRPIIQAEKDLADGLQDTDRRQDAARVFDEATHKPDRK